MHRLFNIESPFMHVIDVQRVIQVPFELISLETSLRDIRDVLRNYK